MDPLTLLGVGGVALFAWLMSRKDAATPSAPSTVSIPPPAMPHKPIAPTVDLDPKVLAADVPYERFGDFFLMGAGNPAVFPSGFKECIQDVAAKIPLSAITQKDYALALRLLGGNMDRAGEANSPESFGLRKAADQLRAGMTVVDLLKSVLSFIPVYGALAKVALSLATDDMQRGINSLAAKGTVDQKIRLTVDLANASTTTKMILGNLMTDCKYLDKRYCNFVGAGSYYYGQDKPDPDNVYAGIAYARQGMLQEYLFGMQDQEIAEPAPEFPHPRLFTRTRTGYVLPWLSIELGASDRALNVENDDVIGAIMDPKQYHSTLTWAETVVTRAKCFRVLDLIISQFWPPVQGEPLSFSPPDQWRSLAGASSYPGKRWSYTNPVFGNIWESTVPPFPGEDTNIVLNGVKLAWDGKPWQKASAVMKYPPEYQRVIDEQALSAANDYGQKAGDGGEFGGDRGQAYTGPPIVTHLYSPTDPATGQPIPQGETPAPTVAPVVALVYHAPYALPVVVPDPPPPAPTPAPTATTKPTMVLKSPFHLYG